MRTIQKGLRILGKVSLRVIRRLHLEPELKENQLWCFIDYAEQSYPLNSVFDILVSKIENDWNHDYKIKVLKVTDQIGRHFHEIPAGYKTICRLEFDDVIPKIVRQLPTLNTWDATTNSIFICRHTDINVVDLQRNYSIAYQSIGNLLNEKLLASNKTVFRPTDIALYADVNYTRYKRYVESIISYMVLAGLLVEKEKKRERELLLVER